jgi:rod shape-determining protein MreD
MSAVRIAIALLLLLLLQSSFVPFLELPLARPDLALILTIYVGLASRPEKATLTGFFAGVGQDAFSLETPGLNPFAKTLIGFLGPTLHRFFMVTNLFVQLIAVAALTALHAMILFWMGEAIRPKSPALGALDFFSASALPEIVSNLVFSALLYPLLRRFLPLPEDER